MCTLLYASRRNKLEQKKRLKTISLEPNFLTKKLKNIEDITHTKYKHVKHTYYSYVMLYDEEKICLYKISYSLNVLFLNRLILTMSASILYSNLVIILFRF